MIHYFCKNTTEIALSNKFTLYCSWLDVAEQAFR
jgi:hypothetical protein